MLCLLVLLTPHVAVADTMTVGGTGAALETIRLLGEAAAEAQPGLAVEVLPSLGSAGGIRALQDGHIDLAVTSRSLTDAERATGLRQFHLAATPIAFVTSQPGDLDLSSSEIVGLYAAASVEWPDGTPVRIILRPEQESLYRHLRSHFPGFAEAIEGAYLRPEVPIAATDQENVLLARRVRGSFTSATLAQIATEAPDLTIISLDGIRPSAEHVVDGSYPLVIEFFLVASAGANEPVRRFLEFARSPQAASILSDIGQVPAARPAKHP